MGRHTSSGGLIVPGAAPFPPAGCSPNCRAETRWLALANKTLGFGRKMIYRQFRNSRVARLSVTCTVFAPVGAPCFGIAQTIRPKKSRTSASAMKSSFLTSALVAAFLCGETYSEAWSSQQGAAPPSEAITVAIPGPLRSFLRMAGISQKVAPDEVLPLLARNVFQRGYEGVHPGR